MLDCDRTSIHEVMEQQTVSIAKAGIVTRLNARTSILAAANPICGRYNTNLLPHKNINLQASLTSRFDVIYVLIDKNDKTSDEELAKHVTYVHQYCKHPINKKNVFNILDDLDKKDDSIYADNKYYYNILKSNMDENNILNQSFIRSYISEAKKIFPIINE